jgi:hypothetical protein
MMTKTEAFGAFFTFFVGCALFGVADGSRVEVILVDSVVVAGLLMFAFAWMARVIKLLTEIRDRLPQIPKMTLEKAD